MADFIVATKPSAVTDFLGWNRPSLFTRCLPPNSPINQYSAPADLHHLARRHRHHHRRPSLAWSWLVALASLAAMLSVVHSSSPRHSQLEPLRLARLVNETLGDDERPAPSVKMARDKQHQEPGGERHLLMSQLAQLIMNHKPERIAQQLNGTRVRGLIEDSSPSRSVGGELVSVPGPLPLEAHASDQDDQTAFMMADQDNQLEQQAAGDQEQNITCSPDYEDQTLIEASGNLTAEQQQQLLAGILSTSAAANASSEPELLLTPSTGGGRPCVQPGSRMIEVITKVITPILFSVIIVVGLLGNIIVMLVILEDRKTERELTPTNLLILDLTLADLSFIIFCILFTGWDYSVGHWVFGSLWCKFNQYLIVVCALSSIYTLVLMSIDRFMAIVYPIECISYRTSKNMLYAIYIKWILILLIASPTVAMHGLVESPMGLGQYNCRFLADQFNPLHFQIVFFITSYLFPLILIFCLYLSLLNKLWFGSRPQGHKESLKMLESKKKVTWLVASIVVVFALCWCPIQVMLILMRLKTHRITATYVAIQVFSHTLGYMNSCVNPIVYAFASETFVNSFKRSSLGRFCCQCFGIQMAGQDHDRSTTTRQNSHYNNRASLVEQYSNSPNAVRYSGQATEITLEHTQGSQMKHDQAGKMVSLPLEPRDRQSSPVVPFANSNGQQTTTKTVLVPRDPTLAGHLDMNKQQPVPSKQQLVARVVQSGKQVSHRCEPDYQ